MEPLTDLEKLAVMFDATPGSDESHQRDLEENCGASKKWIHNLACYFAEDIEEYQRFRNYIISLKQTKQKNLVPFFDLNQ